MMEKHIAVSLILAALVGGITASGWADDRVISPVLGFQPAHTYAISDIEVIDKATGSLALHIPLAQLPPGPAGFTAGVTLSYNNKYWETEPIGGDFSLRESFSGGWRLSMTPSLDVEYIASKGEKDPCGFFLGSELFQLKLTLPDGGRSTLFLSKPVRTMPVACEAGTYRISQLKNENAASIWYTADGSFLRLQMDPPSISGNWPYNSSWTVFKQDGSSIRYEAGSKTTYLRDRNGNRIVVTKTIDSADPTHTYEIMADEFGRTIRLDHFGIVRDEVRQTGHDGTALVWKVYYGNPGPMVPASYICDQSLSRCTFDNPPLQATRLELPTGQAYVFGYERPAPFASNYRELRTVTLPTGARIDYGYRLDNQSGAASYFHILANPVTSKTVSAGGSVIEKWEMSYDINASTGTYSRSVHKAPDGGLTTYDFKPVSYRAEYGLDSGTITRIANPDGSIVNRDWQSNFPREAPISLGWANPWIRREWITNANAAGIPVATSLKAFTADKNGNTTSVAERAWVAYNASLPEPAAGALIRITENWYVNGAVDSANTTDTTNTNAYSHASLPSPATPRNLIESTETRNSSGGVVARSQFNYSETSPARMVGNLVAEYHWDSTKPGYAAISTRTQLSAANAIEKRYEYTARGNVKKETDARGIPSTFDYGSVAGCPGGGTYADLYRTGAHQGQNGTAAILNWSYQYNCNSGKLTSSTDSNSLVTTISYDRYGRPTTIVDGNYRKTVHTYNDSALWIVTQRDVSSFGDLRNVSVLHYDALGRIRLSRQLETAASSPAAAAADESAGIRIDTRYVHALNRNETWVSNPYRSSESSAPTRGWSVTRRDKAGRICVEEWFAGSGTPSVAENCVPSSGRTGAVTHNYTASVNWTREEIVDPAGKTRHLYQDVLGRLVAVREDPTASRYDTYYQYDLLDNLVEARQIGTCGSSDPIASPCGGGQTRTFAYDSLRRLSSASYPELAGNTTSFTYDGNGNLTRKLSSGSPSLLVSYSYDSLNRLQTKDYSDGTTPPVTFCYDGKSWSGTIGGCSGSPTSPSIGRLTEVGSSVSRTSYAYNTAGLVTRSVQTTAGRSYAFGYTYNAAYKLASQTFPSGRTLLIGYDDAGREKYLMGQFASVSKNYAGSSSSGIQYAPHGALSSMTMGNGVVESRGYNSRLQLTRLQAGALLTLWNCFQSGDDAACSSLTTVSANNGNIQGQKIARGSQSWMQKYSYDGVNRLISAQEINVWQQTYGYDPFGNRWVAASSGLPVSALTPTSQSAFAAATNRLAGTYAYDARGNLKSYGSRTLAYDGEDRISAVGGIAPSSRYEYDGEGRRVRAHVCSDASSCAPGSAASTTVYVYDAFGKLAAEYAPNTGQTGTSFLTADHLGSTRLETNASGQAVSCSDYLPFGEEIPSGSGSRNSCFTPTDNTLKFTGKERDAETGLDFFGARYFSSPQGRFTSTDPLNIPNLQRVAPQKFGKVIANPQNWNGYAYAHSNPLRNADPDGYLTIIVPGTGWSETDWNKDSDFYKRVQNAFKDRTVILDKKDWSGGNSREARSKAAGALAEMVKNYHFAPGEKLNIVAHSHGGNVAFQASSDLGERKIDNLVTLGTPIRSDYAPAIGAIGNHINVFSQHDGVQTKGGFIDGWTLQTGYFHLEVGPAGRTLGSAINVDAGVKNEGWIDTHSALWKRESVWKRIEPLLKK
ncbi:MAG: RHS repeat-associated core domain-containing protein [Acidobacteriota bacterium]|nr:RHS repeat-associated core domain-containing protein [Acidobacteriota bacterium]